MYRVGHVLSVMRHDTRSSLFDIITTRGEKGGRGAALTPVPSPAVRGTLTPGPSPAVRGTLTPGPSPAVRGTLTPGPSPAVRGTLTPGPSPAVRGTLTPGPSPAVRGTLTPGPSPAVRGTLTPGPSPALRERGDLGYKCGIVERYRIAPAPLIPPSAPAAWERKGGWGGKVRVPLCLHHIIDRKG
jgi:hypothetical protein